MSESFRVAAKLILCDIENKVIKCRNKRTYHMHRLKAIKTPKIPIDYRAIGIENIEKLQLM
jgi:hypothetical protein